LFRRVMLGPVARPELHQLAPLRLHEGLMLVCFIVCVLAIGVYPAPFLDAIQPDVQLLLARIWGEAEG